MTTDGIEYVFVETHNWGRSATFFRALGFELEFETDHGSGLFRNGAGPYVFVAEVPESKGPAIQVVLKVTDPGALALDTGVEVVAPFEDTHWGTRAMSVRDPDGRVWGLEGPAATTR
ncbi:MAG: VOC family protein [Ilumatobacteraceae bacterium]|jgi:hypothetical protein